MVQRFLLFAVVMIGLFGAACDAALMPDLFEQDPTPTAVVLEPTSEPTKVPTATPRPTSVPKAELGDVLRVAAGGFELQMLTSYIAIPSGNRVDATMVGGNTRTGPVISVYRVDREEGLTLDAMLEDFAGSFDGTITLSPPAPVTINGVSGLEAAFDGDSGYGEISGRIVGLAGDGYSVWMMGFAKTPDFRAVHSAEFEQMLQTLNLLESVAVADPVATSQGNREGSGEAVGKVDVATATPEVTSVPTPAPIAPLTLDAELGVACFGSAGYGISCITPEGAWVALTEANSSLASDYIYDLATCADGTMLILTSAGVQRFDGAALRAYDDQDRLSSADAVACAADGAFWVAHYQGVTHYDGSGWKTYDASELNTTGDELLYDIDVDGAGNVWAITPNAIARYDGRNWTIFEEQRGLDDTYYFDRIAIAPDGLPWILAGDTILKFDGARWEAFSKGDFFSGNDLAIAGNGVAYVTTFADGVLDFDGLSWGAISAENGLSTARTERIGVDDNGRLYVTTPLGLNVWDGASWNVYTMDSAEIVSDDFNTVAIFGGGPQLPTPIDKTNGALTGEIQVDGQPLADATVEICRIELFSLLDEPRCSEQPWYLSTNTDASGAFRFDDLPVGNYYVAFETESGWYTVEGNFGIGSEEFLVPEGGVINTGTLTLPED